MMPRPTYEMATDELEIRWARIDSLTRELTDLVVTSERDHSAITGYLARRDIRQALVALGDTALSNLGLVYYAATHPAPDVGGLGAACAILTALDEGETLSLTSSERPLVHKRDRFVPLEADVSAHGMLRHLLVECFGEGPLRDLETFQLFETDDVLTTGLTLEQGRVTLHGRNRGVLAIKMATLDIKSPRDYILTARAMREESGISFHLIFTPEPRSNTGFATRRR